MAKALVIYHSQEFGNTAAMAQAVAEGLKAAGCEVDMFNTNDGRFDITRFPQYDCAAIGSPDYYSYIAGGLKTFMDDCIDRARQTGYAETIMHRRRKIQNLNSKNGNKRSQAERLAVNTVVQGSAADLIKLAMIAIQHKIDAEDLPVSMLLQIHDELLFELPAAEADTHSEWIAELMTGAIRLDVPLKVDITYGPNWLSGK